MATFKAVVREHTKRRDGKYAVTIRLTHNRRSVYMPTGLYCRMNQISKKSFEIKDQFVLERTNKTIRDYEHKLLELDTPLLLQMTASELRDFLSQTNTRIDYLAYCHSLIEEEPKRWIMLKSALHIIEEMGYKQMYATDFTAQFLREFKRTMDEREMRVLQNQGSVIRTGKMALTTKEGYLKAVCAAFRRLREQYNTEFHQIIQHDPFVGFEPYKKEVTKKRAMSVETLRLFFATKPRTDRGVLTQDVMKISFCLCGINVADLCALRKSNLREGRIEYERQKTKGSRTDRAFSSIRIEPEIEELIRKYEGKDKLFQFGKYKTVETLDRSLGNGVWEICDVMGVEHMSPYWFRHTWATIARNDCDISKDDIDLCLNHVGQNKMADVYIKPDWSRIDRANRKVLDYVFGGGVSS